MSIHARTLPIAFAVLLAACNANPPQAEAPAVAASPKASEAPAAKPAETVAAPATAAKPVEPAAAPPSRKGESHLVAGIAAYENGDHKTARQELQAALDQGLPSRPDWINAHKHLAFIACASQQRDVCKNHFRRILAANSRFALAAAEAGHPLWGPVFKEAQAEAARKPARKK